MRPGKIAAAVLHAGPLKKLFGDFPACLSKSLCRPLVETPEGLDLASVVRRALRRRPARLRTRRPGEAP